MKVIFDLEGDGLNPTKIHCLSYKVAGQKKIKTLTSYDDMRKLLKKCTTLCGHNIVRFDVPVLERILDIKIEARLIDTLSLSWYLFIKRDKHGLDSWAVDLGTSKPKIEDWDNLPLETYIDRCEWDVRTTDLLFKKCINALREIYEDEPIRPIIDYLTFKMHCLKIQSENPFRLDTELVEKEVERLSKIRDQKEANLIKAMPKVPVTTKMSYPKKMFKRNGELSAVGEKYVRIRKEEGYPESYVGDIEWVSGSKEPIPSSPQIKNWLFSLGWEPGWYKYERNKVTNEVKRIPQIKHEAIPGEVCESVQGLFKKEPALEELNELFVVRHRIAVLNGFLRDSKDGLITAEANSLTNTLRFNHKILVNLPGVSRLHAKSIRSSLLPKKKGNILCGSDQSSLEDRTKQHYIYDFDPEYVEEMNQPDFDPHLDLAYQNEFITLKQMNAYKDGSDKSIKPLRDSFKATNYAATYGAIPATISRQAKVSLQQAEKLHKAYWKRNWALKAFAESITIKETKNHGMWAKNPVSGFWYSLRHKKDVFSTINQSTGVYCFDMWIGEVLKSNPQFKAQFHDEIVLEVEPDKKEETEAFLKQCEETVNEELKLNRRLDIDVQFGLNYGEIH